VSGRRESDAAAVDEAVVRLRVPAAGTGSLLVVPACAQGYRVECGNERGDERRGPFGPDWCERRVALQAGAGTEVRLCGEPAGDDPFGGFLPAIGAAPQGFWQGVHWQEMHALAFAARPVARWRDGQLHLRAALVDEAGVPVDARSQGVALSIDGVPARAVDAETWELERASPPLWQPGRPAFEVVSAELSLRGRAGERRDLRLARVELRAAGERLLWNDEPFRVQGLLHWGVYPGLAGPDPEPADLRAELRAMRARGFNLLKACLWVPPQRFLDVCDEEGLAVWIEYPLWNQALGGEGVSRELALRRYAEFLGHDAAHPCVALRTLTCENDRVDPTLAAELLELVEQLAPGGLANDNSAWLADDAQPAFWDEHPYLHAAQWPFWVERTRRALDAREPRPLILGETMAFDALEDEASRRAAVRLRRRQVEQLREVFPNAGYVICAARDIPQSPLGLQDEGGAWKTDAAQWDWQVQALRAPDWPKWGWPPEDQIERTCAGRELRADDLPRGVRITRSLDAATRQALAQGASVLHLASLRRGSWRCPEHTFWSPVASYDALLADAQLASVLEEDLFEELLAGRALVPPPADQGRVLAAARDVHDRSGVERLQPFVIAARLGAGRLIVSALRSDNPAGRSLHRRLFELLLADEGPWLDGLAPLELVPPPRTQFLDGPWDLRGTGVRDGRQLVSPGTLLANRGANALQGWAEAEADFTLPADWSGPVRLRAEAVGDGFELWLDGELVHVHGRPGCTWDAGRDVPATVDLGARLAPGRRVRWRIRTRDHRGAGALIGPLYLCAGDPEASLVY
jgi:hypothetical protein